MVLLLKHITCYIQSGFICMCWSRKVSVLVDFRNLSYFCQTSSKSTLGISSLKHLLTTHYQGGSLTFDHRSLTIFFLFFSILLEANFLYKALWLTFSLRHSLLISELYDSGFQIFLAMTHGKKHFLCHDSEHSEYSYWV